MISRKILKSNASRVQPSQAATQASHCSLVGSFHHGMGLAMSTAIAMDDLPFDALRFSATARIDHSALFIGAFAPANRQRQQTKKPLPVKPEEAFLFRVVEPSQATTSSADISVPLVSGPTAIAKMKLLKPNSVPISIGMAKPTFHVIAKKVRIGGTNPPKIAPM